MRTIFTKKINTFRGFTLIETIVGVAVFLVVALAAYQAYVSLFSITSANQYKILAINLANEQFEIVRNMPYTDIGIVNGIPNGKFPYQQTFVRGNVTFVVTAIIRNIDIGFDGYATSSPADTSPADNKFVDLTVTCATCKNFTPIELSTTVAPKNLETASTNGVLLIKVFNANGVPLKDANVNVTSVTGTTTITVNDITDANGILQIVDAPPGTNKYRITVTQTGYSTDRTYPPGGSGNPSPTKPDATVLVQQVTPTSFSIDQLGTLSFRSVTNTCTAAPNFDFTLTGSKLIGTNVKKYNATTSTDSAGLLTLNNMEWDSYTLANIDSVYDIIGLSPLNPIALNPGASQTQMVIVAPKNPRSLLVTVKDSATGLPLSDATVILTNNAIPYGVNQTTGRGYLTQTDWSGGGGQSTTTDVTKYFADDGNIAVDSPVGEVRLKSAFGVYPSSGILESSTFDTGSASNFHNLTWLPMDQPVAAGATSSLKFQIATATTSSPTAWTFKGPDGTTGTYYNSSGLTINSAHDDDQFIRYRAYLSTISSTSTPNVSDVSFTFTSSCTPPGQVIFSGLTAETYQLVVAKTGYTTSSQNVTISAAWAEQVVLLGP